MSTDPHRYPRADIPASLVCPLCNDMRSFGNELGFRQHMKHKHNVMYELATADERRGMSVEDLKKLPETRELEKLKPWMAFAIARHEVYGESWDEVASGMGKSAGTLAAAANSPAGREFREQLAENLTNPKVVVKTLMESATLGMYMDWLAALEWAKGARDYKAVHSMMKDVGLTPVMAEVERDRGPSTLIVNLGSDSLDGPGGATTLISQAQAQARTPADPIPEAEYIIED